MLLAQHLTSSSLFPASQFPLRSDKSLFRIKNRLVSDSDRPKGIIRLANILEDGATVSCWNFRLGMDFRSEQHDCGGCVDRDLDIDYDSPHSSAEICLSVKQTTVPTWRFTSSWKRTLGQFLPFR